MKKDLSDSLPRAFGPYQLVRRLAVGGMAEVYAAKAEGLGGFEKLVALKVIHPQLSEDEHFIRMLVDEAKLSVLLQHANIAQTFDLGQAEGRYFIVMEYVEGSDVWRIGRRLASAGERFPIEACVYVVGETLAGLEYAHTKSDASGRPLRIVHRDVSPQNILLSIAGEVKLTDFGIAKAALRSTDTEVGVIKGKYDYMSPEQAWGDPVDRRSDVFSAGVVLHELLTGRMLYQEESVPALLDKVRRARIPAPSRLRPEVPAELDAVCLRALARRSEDRYPSAAAFADALATVLYDLDPGYGGPKLARLLDEIGVDDGERPSVRLRAAKTSKTTSPAMRRQEYVPAQTSVVYELSDLPLSYEVTLDDPDATNVFAGPLPAMDMPTPPAPRSAEAIMTAALAKNALRAPPPPQEPQPSDDDETSVFARDRSLLELGFPPPPPFPAKAEAEEMPTPPRGTRAPAAVLRAKRAASSSPPSIEIDPSLVLEAEQLGRRSDPGNESTVVDSSGATARELGAMLAMAADADASGRSSTPSPLPADAARWEPPRRSWDPLPFLGPPLPPSGLVALPLDPDQPLASAKRRPSAMMVAGVMFFAAVAASLAVAFAN